MGNRPKQFHPVAQYFVELLLAVNRLLHVITAPLCNLIDERRLTGPYGQSRYTFCGTVGQIYRRQYNGKIPWRHPLAAFIQHLTEFWYRDKHHTAEAAEAEEAADINTP